MLSPENQDNRKSIDIQGRSYDALAAIQADYARVVDNLAKAEGELLQISRLWSEAEARNAQLQQKVTHLEAEIKDLGDIIGPSSMNDDIHMFQKKLDERHREIASLTKMLKFSQHQVDNEHIQYEWMRSMTMLLLKIPKWWSMLPKRELTKKKNRRLVNSGLFDPEYYINRYPDVKNSGMDPLQHYIFHGIEESRSRCP